MPLLAENHDDAVKEAEQAIGAFAKSFDAAYSSGLTRKIGLLEAQPNDISLAQDLLDRMARNGADFTLVFRLLCDAAADPEGDTGVRMLFADSGAFDEWAAKWRHRLAQEGGERTERRSAMRAAWCGPDHLYRAQQSPTRTTRGGDQSRAVPRRPPGGGRL